MLLGQLLTTTLTTYHTLQANHARDALQGEWDNLSKAVEGRLYRAQPFAEPCYSHPFNSTECTTVREEYTDERAFSSLAIGGALHNARSLVQLLEQTSPQRTFNLSGRRARRRARIVF